ncbi:MAG: lauroyl acyltransferase [Pseudomonadota bacterium]
MAKTGKAPFKDWFHNAAARTILRAALIVPYAARVRLVGWTMTHLVAPFTGWRKRIRENLALALPDLPEAEVQRIVRAVPNNVGRTLIEIYSGHEFLARVAQSPRVGPGVDALEKALAAGKPLVLLTAHLGNYDAVRGTLSQQGLKLGALYKPMENAAFNEHYVQAISTIASPVFPTDGRGIKSLVRHLKDGGAIGIVGDVGSTKAPVLQFFGHDAGTPLSAAEWALKYDAEVIPIYGIRQPDGLSFELFIDVPIARGTAQDMMQKFNDSVEAVVRDNLDQWFWIHRRWKTLRRKRAAAT